MADRGRGRIVRWLAAVPTSIWFLVGLGLILGVSALFGGLDDADLSARQPPVVVAEEEIARDELTTVIHSAVLTDLSPGYSFDPEEGFTYLVVEGTVTNNGLVTTISFDDLLRIEALEEPAVAHTARTIDNSTLPQLNPLVPTGIAFVWEVPEDAFASGDTVRLTVQAKTFTRDGDITFGSYWSDPQPTAYVDVVVR